MKRQKRHIMGRFSFGLDLRKLYISIVKLFDAPRFTKEKLMVIIKSTITPLVFFREPFGIALALVLFLRGRSVGMAGTPV